MRAARRTRADRTRPHTRRQRRPRLRPGAKPPRAHLREAPADRARPRAQDGARAARGGGRQEGDGGGARAQLRHLRRRDGDLRGLRGHEPRDRRVQLGAGRRRGRARQGGAFAQAALLRQSRPAVQARAGAQGALHRHRRHLGRELPPPRGGLALARGRDLLQPGQRPHLVRGRRPHHRSRPQAAPPVRHRGRPPESLFRHHGRHSGLALAGVALEAAHRADEGHHGHHPEGAEHRRAPRGRAGCCW